MKRVLLTCTLVCIAISGCDSADDPDRAGAVADDSTLRTAPAEMMSFDSREAFLSAVEAARASFSSPDASDRTTLPARSGFKSLYAAQQEAGDVARQTAGTDGLVATLPDVPDPALASVLNSAGDVLVGSLRYRFGTDEAVAYAESGEVVSRHPASDGPVAERGGEYYASEACAQFGPIRIYNRPLYQVCGRTWNRSYFGIYASQGSRTDHYKQERSVLRGWYYADDNAADIRIYCTDGNNGVYIGSLSANYVDTLTLYFDRGLFGTGNDTNRLTNCEHYSGARLG